ncbi:hypothetical protein D0907_14785 [Pseudoalteromonas lipolytica]|uniref:4-alpha-L-fucosyltransferase n=1 Tax=Pseudoalteromonas lipolytica TaxID=570156 RepID=A0AAD0S267_9GAMM|nr:TDP-N-acetylfucosamine:lipid II N-acetylfucosaminyltransferase [Pseudoalteromonas donghaensis]AXV66462.1 hypothetical protein D0907_14785 [Pseudoalteromonas donghaensis]
MRNKKILHVAECDKFIPPYIDFIKQYLTSNEEHEFLLKSGMADSTLRKYDNILLEKKSKVSKFKYYFKLIIKMHFADKVILHSLIDIKIVQILFFTPWLLKKCYWVIWGADLYAYNQRDKTFKWKVKEFFRHYVISNMGHLVTYLKGDVELARRWYGAKGKHHECLMYTSNLYKEFHLPERKKATLNIQIGNSADPSNNHIDALERLLPFKKENIYIFVPLAYGQQEYAQEVIKKGKEWFGDKFKPLLEFMPFEEYLSFLASIDIAIFNHKRQQAMGNTITLLGLGKVVYLRRDTTQWDFFKEKNIHVRDIEKLTKLEREEVLANAVNTKEYFSKENFKQQLSNIFSY